MARAPFQVLVYLYRNVGGDDFEYALLKRSDAGYWQAVAGGGENNETPLEAARRETFEEAGIGPDSPFLPLDTVIFVRVTEFKDSPLWGESIFVIPMYCFGVLVKDQELVLSHEHTDSLWLTYEEADRLMAHEGNKTALWELESTSSGRDGCRLCPKPHCGGGFLSEGQW